jgi:hypothetical protein
VYCFRLAFTMSSRTLLGLAEAQFFLQDKGQRRVWLKSSRADDERLCDAINLVVRGKGYTTEDEAALEGERWRDVISRAFARVHLAADFGDRMVFGVVTKGRRGVALRAGGSPSAARPAWCQTFEVQPGLRFVASNAEACRRPSEERKRQVLAQAARLEDPLRVLSGWPLTCTAAHSSSRQPMHGF